MMTRIETPALFESSVHYRQFKTGRRRCCFPDKDTACRTNTSPWSIRNEASKIYIHILSEGSALAHSFTTAVVRTIQMSEKRWGFYVHLLAHTETWKYCTTGKAHFAPTCIINTSGVIRALFPPVICRSQFLSTLIGPMCQVFVSVWGVNDTTTAAFDILQRITFSGPK